MSEVSFANFSLEDHWNQGDALEAIDRAGLGLRRDAAGAFDPPAEPREPDRVGRQRSPNGSGAVGARPAIYMIWPSNGDFDAVSQSYTEAAHAVNGMLIPAGEAFRSIDGDHPEITIFQATTSTPPRSAPTWRRW